MNTYSYPNMPPAPDTVNQRRWNHTGVRRRIMQGVWEQDLEESLLQHLSSDRRAAWGVADMSSNTLEQVTRQLAMLYQEQPTITHKENIEPLIERDGYLLKAGLFPLMQRVQQYAIALREVILKIDVINGKPNQPKQEKGFQFRIVTPDFVYCESHPDAPDIPVYYREYRLRYDADTDDYKWIADVFDIRTGRESEFALYEINTDGSLGLEVTEKYTGNPKQSGDDYPYRSSAGIPFLPIQIYRAEKTGELWNSFDSSSLTYGTLTSAVLFSFYLHLVRDACWSQKYVAGLHLAGMNQLDQDLVSRRAAITTDPSSILVFTPDPDINTQPLIGTFEPSADPEKLLESVAKYEYRVATAAGISSEVLRQSGDPRSGYALSISREGQREAQRKYAPLYRSLDESMLSKVAMMANIYFGDRLPESGYRVQYQQLRLSPEEMKAIREDCIAKLNAGLISPVDAIMLLNPDLDELEAKNELIRIRRERAEFG